MRERPRHRGRSALVSRGSHRGGSRKAHRGPARRSDARVPRLAVTGALGAVSAIVLGVSAVAQAIGGVEPVPVESETLAQETATTSTSTAAPPVSLPEPVQLGADSTARRVTRAGLERTEEPLDIPDVALSAYQRAAAVINDADPDCRLDWTLVAAVGYVESDHGRYAGSRLDDEGVAQPEILGVRLDGDRNTQRIKDTDAGMVDGDRRFDRAVGPMQIIPSTWSLIGVDADGDEVRDPQDIDDAALAAAVYLCSGSEDLSTNAGRRAAVHRYNPLESYVDLVLEVAKGYADLDDPTSFGGNVDVLSTPGLTPSSTPPAVAARTPSSDDEEEVGASAGTPTKEPVRPSDDPSPSSSPSSPPTTSSPSTPPTSGTPSPSDSASPSASGASGTTGPS